MNQNEWHHFLLSLLTFKNQYYIIRMWITIDITKSLRPNKIPHFILFLSTHSFSSIFIKFSLADTNFLGSYLQKFIISNIANSLLNWHDFRWNKNDFLIVGMSSDVSELFLFRWVYLYIIFFIVLSNDQAIVNSHTRLNK